MTLSQLWCSSVLIRTDLWHIIDQNEKTLKLHNIWFLKMKNSDKMDKNNNFAIIGNKQDYLVIITMYNKKKITPSQLQDSLGLTRTDLWHLFDQNEKK